MSGKAEPVFILDSGTILISMKRYFGEKCYIVSSVQNGSVHNEKIK